MLSGAFERWTRDLSYACRVLRRAPVVTLMLVLTLALGIGANTAVFSILQAVLVRPLPYLHPERLVAIWDGHVREANLAKVFASYDDFETWSAHSTSFEELAAVTWATGPRTFKLEQQARSVLAIPASVELFRLLGVASSVGRTFAAADVGGCSIVLSHAFWQQALGSDPRVVGRGATLDDQSCTVIGVMPATFRFFPAAADMWSLMPATGEARPASVGVFGRLKPGVSIEVARAELRGLHRPSGGSSDHRETFVPTVYPLQDEFTWLAGRNLRSTLLVLFVVVGVVLLIACVNVANMLLARTSARLREFAVRAAMGSGAWHLTRQLLVEALVLSMAGAAVGTALAVAAIRWFRAATPVELPVGAVVTIDRRVLVFTAVLIGLTAVGCVVAPAWAAARVDISRVLKAAAPTGSDSRQRRRVGGALVILEIACSVALLVGAAMLVESVSRLGAAPLGFDPSGLWTLDVRPPRVKYDNAARRTRLYDELTAGLTASARVDGIALSSTFAGRGVNVLAVQGRPQPAPDRSIPDVEQSEVSESYFRVMRMPLRAGRPFDERDREGSQPVAIINEALARKYFPAGDAIGQSVRCGSDAASPWLRVVGVVGNRKSMDLYREMAWAEAPVLYRSIRQSVPATAVVHLRASADKDLAATVRSVLGSIDLDVATGELESMEISIAKTLSYPRFRAVLAGGFAGVGLLLAVVGVYGVLAQLVGQRTGEIGIRMALGAQRRSVLLLVLHQGAWLVGSGLAGGLIAITWIEHALRAMLTDVRPSASLFVAAVLMLFLVVAFLAMYIPARRATRISPLLALRGD